MRESYADLVTIREATDEDMSYVRSSWMQSAHRFEESKVFLASHGKRPPWQIWRALFPAVMDALLKRSKCFVACANEAPDVIIGYAIVEQGDPFVVHWCQVKQDAWRRGVARKLMTELGVTKQTAVVYTNTSPFLQHYRPAGWSYVPMWLARGIK